MKLINVSLMLLAIAASPSCRMSEVVPSSNMVSYEVAAPKINSIDVESSIAVSFMQSDVVKVSVSCPENLSDLLEITVAGGKLEAGFKDGVTVNGDCNVVVTVSAPYLNTIDASSSSSVEIASGLKQTGSLDIDVSSSAQVVIAALQAGEVNAEVSSSALLELKGVKTSELDLDCSSSAKISASGLECVTVIADASSASKIELSGVTMYASYEASSASSIDARSLTAENLKKAEASSAASIRCSAEKHGPVSEESSGSVSIE